MKLRGQLGFEFDIFFQKRSKSHKGSRDNKIQKEKRTGKLMPLLLQLITEIAQAFVIALGATLVVDYLKSGPIGNSWIIIGIVMIVSILFRGFRLKSS